MGITLPGEEMSELIATKVICEISGSGIFRTPYPLGQHIRGAFGELFYRMESPVAKTFEDTTPTVYYFRDALPLHHDGVFLPEYTKEGTVYRCSTCKRLERYVSRFHKIYRVSLDRETKRASGFPQELREGKFRFEIIVKEVEGSMEEMLRALNFFREYGLRLGSAHNKGYCSFRLDYRTEPITVDHVVSRGSAIKNLGTNLKVHLLSDAIIRADIHNSIVTACKFFHDFGRFQTKVYTRNLVASKEVFFLDYKASKGAPGRVTQHAVPAGTVFELHLENVEEAFYSSLALAEQCYGFGARVSAGKGHFRVVV